MAVEADVARAKDRLDVAYIALTERTSNVAWAEFLASAEHLFVLADRNVGLMLEHEGASGAAS